MSPYIDWMFITPTVRSSLWKLEWNCVQIDTAITDIDSTQMGYEFYCNTFFSTIPKLLHFTLWDKTSFAIVMKNVTKEQKSLWTCTELSWKTFCFVYSKNVDTVLLSLDKTPEFINISQLLHYYSYWKKFPYKVWLQLNKHISYCGNSQSYIFYTKKAFYFSPHTTKVVSLHIMNLYGGVEVELHAFLTSAQDWGY